MRTRVQSRPTLIRKSAEFRLANAVPANYLRDLRNEALRAGKHQLASSIKAVQALRKQGLHTAAECELSKLGLAVDSGTDRSRWPVAKNLTNRSYRECHNLVEWKSGSKHVITKVKPERLPYAHHENTSYAMDEAEKHHALSRLKK